MNLWPRNSATRTREAIVIVNATNLGKFLDGIGIYTLNLLRELSHLNTSVRFVIYVNRTCEEHLEEVHFSSHCTLRWVSGHLSPDHRFKGHLLRLLYANYLALKHRGELIFATSQLEAILFKSNQIITIHDVIPLLFKKCHKKQYYYYRYILPRVLRNARGVVTPSYHTRALLIQHYSLDPGQVHAIHNGVHEKFLETVVGEQKDNERFILFTGRIVRMKNITGMLRAFALIKDIVPHKLVIVGHGRHELKKEFDAARLSNYDVDRSRVEFKGHVSFDEMVILLNRASALVFPTFYEGFGLPPLEGMACGCPVVVSDVASLPEVCGDAAVYVNPYDEQSIANGINTILNDSVLRENLISKGRERAKCFSWKESAQSHLSLFIGVLQTESASRVPIDDLIVAHET